MNNSNINHRGHGSLHFWTQRLSAIALIPLLIWICYNHLLISIIPNTDNTLSLTTSCINLAHEYKTLYLLFVITMIYHVFVGLQVVIEDYVHHTGVQKLCLWSLLVLCFKSLLFFAFIAF